MSSALSIFDLDHTLLNVNSSFKFGSYLRQRKIISTKALFKCLFYYFRHKYCSLSLNDLHQKSFESLFKGRSKDEVEHLVSDFLSEYLNEFLYLPALNRLKEAQRQGHHVVILSSSPDFLVGPISRQLNVQEFQATVYETNEANCFTHISHVLDGQEKADYVRKLACKHSLPTSSITVYSDSYLDLPILKLAGKAVGVVPDKRLRRICLTCKWEII